MRTSVSIMGDSSVRVVCLRRHSGALRGIEPGISKLFCAQLLRDSGSPLRAVRNDDLNSSVVIPVFSTFSIEEVRAFTIISDACCAAGVLFVQLRYDPMAG